MFVPLSGLHRRQGASVRARSLQTPALLLLAMVFSGGLTFATVEIPALLDELLQTTVTTPNLDSHASEFSRLQTELFIAQYHVRFIGYVCFFATLALIVAGFVTRRTTLATAGALGFMLPVFAQFAGVMFFLAGLGVLNALWLPVLDISFELSRLGLIIRVPYDLASWLLRQLGIRGYWPITYSCLGMGLLLFTLGTFAWLSARARGEGVAGGWVYRISRHPQYMGWIVWSYGVYLLLLREQYPRRTWGIDASLPWLLSTLTIIGVAMLEELRMRQRHGDAYAEYHRRAPFLFPVPRVVARIVGLPCRLLFKRSTPERTREVAGVLSVYAVLLVAASAFFYGGGWARATAAIRLGGDATSRMESLARQVEEEPNRRAKYFLSRRLAAFGDPVVDYALELLASDQAEVRLLAAELLRDIPSARSVSSLISALDDPIGDVRGRAAQALGAIGVQEATGPLLPLLDDPEAWIRTTALRSLAMLGAEATVDPAETMTRDPESWIRVAAVEALGILGSEGGLPIVTERLGDESAWVRRTAAVALLEIGSPLARDALRQALDDEDWEVRLYAAQALRRLPRE
jgi:protein-S-isoprenylcysteine O-methyltransferase Ste14